MPTSQLLPVKKLALDEHNFRTVRQSSEAGAIHALIALEPDYFWNLMHSLLDDGYLLTENIIVLTEGKKQVVKEGNRRIACLKIALGYVAGEDFQLPSDITDKIANLPAAWKKANASVPCTVYESAEKAAVDRVVTLTHGKGQKAGRLPWPSVARARHNRDMLGTSEPALDLLEKYLVHGKNLTSGQAERWAGTYAVSVLEEAIKRVATRVSLKSSSELAKAYPKVAKRDKLDELMLDIGLERVGFKEVRADGFGESYGMPAPIPPPSPPTPAGKSPPANPSAPSTSSTNGGAAPKPGAGSKPKSPKAHATEDPRSVRAALRAFSPRGKGREKVVTLLEEMRRLKVDEHAHAFCFLLRSMFEISAKAYCVDHAADGLSATKKDGNDRPLVEVLRDVVGHLTHNKTDKVMLKHLQGAMTQLAKNDSILSVTSMNQLIHNRRFVVTSTDICALFANVFPLLEEMNR